MYDSANDLNFVSANISAVAAASLFLRRLSLYALASSLMALSMPTMGFCQIAVNDPSASILQNRYSPFVPDRSGSSVAMPLNGESSTTPQPSSQLQPAEDRTGSENVENAATSSNPSDIHAKAVLVDINSDTLNYDKDHDVYIATGAVHMVISEQNSELYSDKLTYDRNQNLAIAEGKVVIIKNGQRTEGSYAKIDLTRKSALINDVSTTLSAVRIKAKQSLVNNHELIFENGRLVISGQMYQQLAAAGGLNNIGQNTGKGSQQAKLSREYSKKVYANRAAMMSQLSYDEKLLYQSIDATANEPPNYDDTPDKISRFNIKAREINMVRNEDGYDDISLKHSSLYAGKYKLFNLPDSDFSFDGTTKNIQYLGPDIGSYRAYGGAYLGPGWDFHTGPGSIRFSPIVSYGSVGFWAPNGKDGKTIKAGLGVGGILHYRDSKTTADLSYSSHVGTPILFFDRQLGQSTHLMATYNDSYVNGLLGQTERPTYIAQVTDYRVLKDFNKFQLTAFESAGFAKDNFYPNFRQTYFVSNTGRTDPQTLGRAQLQLQVNNTAPLVRFGPHASLGMRAQLLTAAYTSADFLAIGRIGPTFNVNLFDQRLQSSIGYTVSHSIGKTPFVFDSYYGGKQNLSLNNLFRINKYLSIGNSGSYSLNRDNARHALAVGNLVYFLVGPQDLKAQIGYDFIYNRSYFGLNYYPGTKNSVIGYDKMRVNQPTNYTQPGSGATF
jgi:hypothetical protein